MSLLAEALKKSQKPAGQDPAAKPNSGIAPSGAAPAASPSSPFSFSRLSLICAAAGLVIYLAIVMLSDKPKNIQAVAPESASPPSPALEGIVWDEQAPLALLAGKPCRPGEFVAGWRIESIAPDSVTLSTGRQKRTLTLPATPRSS